MNADEKSAVQTAFAALVDSGTAYHRDYKLQPPGRPPQLISEAGSLIDTPDGERILVVLDPVCAGENARQELYLQTLLKVINVLASVRSDAVSIDKILETLACNLGWEIAEFWQLDSANHKLQLSSLWIAPEVPQRDEYRALSVSLEISESRAMLTKVWLGGEPAWSANLLAGEIPERRHLAESIGLQTALWFPIAAHGRRVGIVGLYSRGLLEIDTRLLEILDCFGTQLAQLRQQVRTIVQLSASEHRFRQMFEENEAVKLVIDPTNGSIVDANQSAVDFYGYTCEQLKSMRITDINMLPTAEVHACMSAAESEHRNQFRFEHRLADGQIRKVHVYSSPFESDGRRYLYSTIFDVTEQHRAQEALKETAEHLRLVFEHTPAAVAIFDRQMRYLFATRRWLHDYNLGDRQVIGFTHYEVFPEIQQDWKDIHQRCLAGESLSCEEDRFVRLDGSIDWVRWFICPWRNSGGSIGGIIMFTEVVTGRKLAADRIRESEAKYRSLFDNLIDACAYHKIIIDDSGRPVDYEYLEVNTAFERMTGLARDQVIGRRVTEILPGIESAPQKWIEVYGDIALNGGTLRKEDYSRELDRWYTISAYSPESGYFVAVFEDITERKQAEAAAREAQRAAAALLGNLPGMAYRCLNDRDWTMEYISEGCLELTGYSTTELINSFVLSYNDLIHPDDRDFVWREVQEGVKKNRRYRMTYRIVSRNREVKWVWEQGAALRDDKGNVTGLEGFIADITDRVRAEEALHHREERFRALIESSSDIIMLFDERGCVTYTSPSTARILGYSPGEIVGRTIIDKVDHRELRKLNRAFLKVINHPRAEFSLEVRVRHRDGSPRILESVGRNMLDVPDVRAIVVNSRDITDRRAVEIERAQMAAAVDQAVEGMVITDIDGRIIYANAAFERLTGFARSSAIGRLVRSFFATFEGNRAFAELWPQVQMGEPWVGRYRNQRANNDTYDEELAVSPIRGEGGKIVNLVFVKRDISREVDLEGRLRQSHKLEAVGRLASGIAHDFNNLLAGIRGFAELIVAESGSDQRSKDYADEIVRAATRAADLTGQLLAFARKGNYLAVPVDLHSTVKEVTRILEHTIDRRIEIRSELNARIATTKGDPSQIQSAVLNLCVNARDAMPEGGLLTFHSENVQLDADFCRRHGLESSVTDYIALSVHDTGTGIDEALIGHIFDPFFTTKEQGQGTGLGLAGVYGCVRNHKGCVEVKSQVGKGSSFTLYLPVFETAESPRPPQMLERETDGRERILVVDDETVVRNLAERILSRAGYKVFTCENGAEAADFYRTAHASIDAVILDMIMPRLNGIDTLAELRRVNPDVKVVFLSGYAENIGDTLREYGAAGFIQKPFQMQELLEGIRRVLDHNPRSSRSETPKS